MRVLVTGGAGLIGHQLCARLLADGHDVVCLDDLSSGSQNHIAPLRLDERFSFLFGCVEDRECYVFKPDLIYHLACPASPVHYRSSPCLTIEACTHGTANVLAVARATKARVLFTSTSEVYGNPEEHPQWEGYAGKVDVTHERACYSEGKRAAEAMCYAYARQYGVDVRVARLFNVYGPTAVLDDGRVITNFVVQAMRCEPITVYGDGFTTRSFCFVSDCVEALVRLMGLPSAPGPVNIGMQHETTLDALAEMVCAVTGNEVPVIHADAVAGDPSRRCPDMSLVRKLLDWESEVSLEEGLDRLVEEMKRRGLP